MNAEKEKVTRVKVTLKKELIQNRKHKEVGDEIMVTPDQKERLAKTKHI